MNFTAKKSIQKLDYGKNIIQWIDKEIVKYTEQTIDNQIVLIAGLYIYIDLTLKKYCLVQLFIKNPKWTISKECDLITVQCCKNTEIFIFIFVAT